MYPSMSYRFCYHIFKTSYLSYFIFQRILIELYVSINVLQILLAYLFFKTRPTFPISSFNIYYTDLAVCIHQCPKDFVIYFKMSYLSYFILQRILIQLYVSINVLQILLAYLFFKTRPTFPISSFNIYYTDLAVCIHQCPKDFVIYFKTSYLSYFILQCILIQLYVSVNVGHRDSVRFQGGLPP